MDRPGHGLERRQGQGARVDRHQGGQGGREGSGVGEAHAVDHRHRRRGARRVPRRRRRDRRRRTRSRRCRSSIRETLEFEVQRRRPRLDRRPRRPGDPAAVAREDVAADAGVSRQELLRHRRHLDVRARAELLPARLRHGAGLHRGDARSRDRPERHQGAERRAGARSSRSTPTTAGRRVDDFVGLRRDRVVAQSKIRRPDEKDYRGGYEAEGYAAEETGIKR